MAFETHAACMMLLPLLPLVASLTLVGKDASGQRRLAQIALGAFVVTLAGAVSALIDLEMQGAWTVRLYEPGSLESWVLPLGMHVDRFSAVMMVLIASVGTLIFRYSTSYMDLDPGYGRFLALIGVTTSTLLVMVASPNLLMVFLCWQLLSYLLALLSHNLGREPTRRGAMATFWCLRLGDAAYLLGIALWSLYGTLEIGPLLARAAQGRACSRIGPGVEIPAPLR